MSESPTDNITVTVFLIVGTVGGAIFISILALYVCHVCRKSKTNRSMREPIIKSQPEDLSSRSTTIDCSPDVHHMYPPEYSAAQSGVSFPQPQMNPNELKETRAYADPPPSYYPSEANTGMNGDYY